MALSFTENRARNIGLSVTSNPRTVLNSVGLLEASQAEAIAGTVQNRYISPLRLDQVLTALGIGVASSTTDDAIARYDGINGALQNSGLQIDDSANIFPTTTGVGSLGKAGALFAGVFLAAAATINWGAGDVVATHSTNALAWTGASSGYSFDASVTGASFIPSGSTVPTNGMYLPAANTLGWAINSAAEMQLTATVLSPAASGGLALGNSSLPWDSAWHSKTVTASPDDAGGSTPSVSLFRVSADNFAAGSGFIIGMQRRYVFGGSSVTGGRISGYDFIANTAATNASNTNRNYVAHQGYAYTAVGDGGSDTSTNAKGAYFGGASAFAFDTGTSNAFHGCGHEIDCFTAAGTTFRYSTGLFVAGFEAARGVEVDAAIAISGASATGNFGPHIGWKHAFLCTDIAGVSPFYASSVVFGHYWTGGGTKTVDKGFDLTGFTCTSGAFLSTGFTVGSAGAVTALSLTAATLIGGTAAGDDLTFKTTTGNGSGDNFIWVAGNNGATTRMTLSSTTLELGDGIHTFTLGDNGSGQTIIKTDGGSTNASIQVRPKGTGAFGVYNDSAGPVAVYGNAAGATASTNFYEISNAASGGTPICNIHASSVDTNVSWAFRTKGTGSFLFQTAAGGEIFSATSTGAMGMPGAVNARNALATPAAASAVAAFLMGSALVGIYWGTGTPNAVVTAPKGSIYIRTDGSTTATRMYINTDASTAWTNFTTAA